MRLLLHLCSLTLVAASIGAFAQSGTNPTSAPLPKIQPSGVPLPKAGIGLSDEEIRTKGAEWHAECMRDWDRQTHMTKREWTRTCDRVVGDRVQWLRGQGKQ
jgi:hypothetical protein